MRHKSYIRKFLVASLASFTLWGAGWAGAQTTANSVNLFSRWVKLSLMGFNQSEIEATLSSYTPDQLQEVKHRLRRNVMNNLLNGNLQQDIELSTTEQELRYIREKIRTEIRFAGLENDRYIRRMIRHQFGIIMADI
jgi:hypothetical protein